MVYLNFILEPDRKSAFSGNLDVDTIILNLSALIPGSRFIKGKTCIIPDEIQECKEARTSLKSFHLDGSFDVIATGDDVRRSKPWKDIYELCLIRLGIDGSDAIVFEDTIAGIESGRSAGCRVVSLMTTIDGEMAGMAGADAVISDLSAIPSFSSPGELEHIISDFSGKGHGTVYGANEIIPMEMKMPHSFIIERAKRVAREAWENAYAPYSAFKVGAAVLSAATGRIYPGCNVENSSYGATICAERNAITTAIAAEGTIGIDLLVVCSDDDPPAPPCAVCLQVIAEYARPDTHIVLFSVNGQERHYAFSELLPNPFVFPTMRR